MPNISEFVQPILFSLPIQLLAYYVAVFKKTDVDQPRIAKSVTIVWNGLDKKLSEIYLRFTQKITNLYLSNYPLSEYQKFLLRIIYRLRNQGYSWIRVSQYLNESRLKSTRGKQFTPNLVSQIIKKNQIRKKRGQNDFEVQLSDFYLEIE